MRIVNGLRLAFRFLQLAAIFGPVIIAFPVWYLQSRDAFSKDETPQSLWWVRFMVKAFEISGPTFTKLGQWASSRTDLFPPYVCELLAKLQSNNEPHSLAATRKIILGEFGKDIDELFKEFNPIPIGVGAIAQVYKATLAQPDLAERPQVAVKVLHPGVDILISNDLKIMHMVASLLHLLPGAEWLSFPDEVETFGHMMREQLDLRNEAENLRRFKNNFEKRPAVTFPEPVDDLVRQTVLVETYWDALPISKFLNSKRSVFDRELADIGLDAFLHMLVIDNFTHADLHPGNIFVTFRHPEKKGLASMIGGRVKRGPNDHLIDSEMIHRLNSLSPEEWPSAMETLKHQGYAPQLIFLDAGLVSELSPTNLVNFLDLFFAIAEFNGPRVGHLMVERSRTPWTVVDPEAFQKKMEAFLARIRAETLQLSKIKVGEILGTVFGMVRGHHIKIEGDFANVGISIMLIEGIGRRLDPNMDLLAEALPVLREAKQRGLLGGGKGGGPTANIGEGLGWDVVVKLMLYKWMRPLLRIGDEWFEIQLYEDSRQFFPDF
ncbi:hypothetical protein HK104_004322 [Borealophlyctis nickersoniae]|nr:hypothetical protein HK104_004322 [Borealophlyctis nickersoniae]